MVWELPTNYSNGTIADTPGKFFIDWPSSVIPEFGGAILLLIWMMVFGVTYVSGSKKAILTSCFITSIFAIFFAIRSWVNPAIAFGMIVLTIIGAIGMRNEASL